ncbi:MAG: ABC-F family ATP-binding cassette domain-containing protein [Bacteroidales bacterium]|jgi:ATP-binding cassette subfamily F protein uup|nr:ABC-F family ATP-binding cassette domain-containing protein [Bacteroidales bacterium]
MNYLSIENLSKYYGDKLLFEDISFGIDKGQKVALIAKNGTGKTSLLNIINGFELPDKGSVTIRGNIRIGYLPQIFDSNENISVLDSIFDADTQITKAIKEYETAFSLFNEKPTPENRFRMETSIVTMDNLQAWDFESKAKEILSKFDIPDILKNIQELSGGQRKKIALVKVLLSNADFLILDEPTNHLDIEMIEWLENYLAMTNITLLMVTHDRFFLDKVCSDIMELENGNLYRYKGKYDYYLEKKEERIANTLAEINKAKSIYHTELEWMRATPQARTTKAKARIDNFENIKQKAFVRLEEKNKDFAVKTERIGNKILEINNLDFSFADQVILDDFSYIFKKGERCGIIGKNGSGKTTFLRLIINELKPNAGKITFGETIVFGYYSQTGLSLENTGKRAIDIVKEHAEMIRMADGNYVSASHFLNHFGFTYENQYTYFENLSGGQRRKLHLLMVLITNPNFLIMDEPTNDFDIEMLTLLEDFLLRFTGCLLIVSHDRWFMDKLVDHIFIMQGNGKVKDFYGNYTDYKTKLQQEERIQRAQQKAKKTIPLKQSIPPNTGKVTYKEQKEFEFLELEIERLEKEKSHYLELLNAGNGTPEELTTWAEQYAKTDNDLDIKTTRWIELSDKIKHD